MTQNYARLEWTADYSSGEKTVAFELGIGAQGAAEISESVRTGYLIGGGGQVLSVIANLIDPGAEKNQQFFVDLGAGQHIWELSFQAPLDTKKEDGSFYQWGSSASATDGPNEHTATGVTDPLVQQNIFMHALNVATFTSGSAITLSVGEYSDSGILSPEEVVPENPSTSLFNDRPERFDGSITLISSASLDDVYDAQQRTE